MQKCFECHFCIHITLTHPHVHPPTDHIKYHSLMRIVPEKYRKPPSYCRSICADRVMKISSKASQLHGRKDGFKKRKKTSKRSENDLLLLSNYRNKNIPTGT